MGMYSNKFSVAISAGASLSGVIDLDMIDPAQQNLRVSGLITPSNTTASSLSLQVSADGINFYDLRDNTDSEIVFPVTAGKAYTLPIADYSAFRWIKLRSGTSASPVNQDTYATFTLIVRVVL